MGKGKRDDVDAELPAGDLVDGQADPVERD